MRLIDPKGDGYDQVVRVYYNKDMDDFFARVPAHLALNFSGTMGEVKDGDTNATWERLDGTISAMRPGEVLKKVERQVWNYRHAVTQKRRVIVYDLQLSEDMAFEKGNGLLVEWHACWRLDVGSRIELVPYEPADDIGTVTCNNYHVGNPEDFKIIDWTKEREEFFRDMDKALDKIKLHAKKVLGAPEAQLIAAIESGFSMLGGQKALPAPKKKVRRRRLTGGKNS